MEMPHSEEFKTKTHPELVATKYDKCQMCHAPETTFFCEKCHHGEQVGWEYDTTADWRTQHGRATVETGVSACTTTCHEVQFCVDCHAAEQPVPTSHDAADWLHKDLTVTKYPDTPAVASAKHALDAQKSIDSCDICHGPGGIAAKFCADCHKIEIPHPETFKTNHVTGRDTPSVCANCHQQKELCSDCHHQGAVNGTPWQKQHPVTVASSGADSCFQKCHENKQFCVDCHMELDALPTSHEAKDWTKRASIDEPAKHQVAYKETPDSCTYCHGEGGVTAKYCTDCHGMEMPHPSGFKDTHKADFEAKKYTQEQCEGCHVQYFCDRCHHEGAVESQPWRTYHPNIVKQTSADPCFECHEETECSYCHVRL
jgi:hypothetical protein